MVSENQDVMCGIRCGRVERWELRDDARNRTEIKEHGPVRAAELVPNIFGHLHRTPSVYWTPCIDEA